MCRYCTWFCLFSVRYGGNTRERVAGGVARTGSLQRLHNVWRWPQTTGLRTPPHKAWALSFLMNRYLFNHTVSFLRLITLPIEFKQPLKAMHVFSKQFPFYKR